MVAPGTAVSNPDDIALVAELADYLGLKLKFGSYVRKGSGYKSRTSEERVEDIHRMFSDTEVKAVFCIRGGYGSPQLLDRLDYDLIRSNPKIFLGYSDITALHLAINKFSGLVTFHGPVMLSSFSKYTFDHFYKALFDTTPVGTIRNSDAKNFLREAFPVRTIRPGKAKGRLTGGNLSLISALMGTPYEIETAGRIVCIEDVDEEPFRIDRMLTQLSLAGKLSAAAGIAFGRCSGCEVKDSSQTWDYSLGEVLDNILGKLDIPVFYGLNFGHTSEQATLPFGVEAEIDADEGVITVTEAGVV